MEALQYIYTSWKNGDSTEKGYMVYSCSEGISQPERSAIKDAMQYLAPKALNPAPTPQEIVELFPYAFSYFILPTGRGCVAQSTYIGKDYSGRYGNYIIYALVFDLNDLPCRPAELFAEPYIKTAMTEEELNAPSPVPPLPALKISQYATVINDDQLNESFFDKEAELAQVIAMVLAARDSGVPFYMNDTRENLVLWSAAIQRVLPPKLSRKFTFNTYVGDHEAMRSTRIQEEGLDFCLIGVRPDANYFNYATEALSNRNIVVDFVGGNMTQGVEPNGFAQAMAESLTMDYEEIDSFGEFADNTTLEKIDGRLQDAYLCYCLLKHDEIELSDENLIAVISFGTQYCTEADNSDIGSKLLVMLQESSWKPSLETIEKLWSYVCKYSSFMLYTLYDVLQTTVFHYADKASAPCADIESSLFRIRSDTPEQWKEYLIYFNSPGNIDQIQSYLAGHQNVYTNSFYISWLKENYSFENGLNDGQPVSNLFKRLLDNTASVSGGEKSIVEILFATADNHALFKSVIQVFIAATRDSDRFEKLCAAYSEVSENCPEATLNRIEQMLAATPEAAPIVSRLCSKRIALSRKPVKEFWRIYENHCGTSSFDIETTVTPMIYACLNSVDGGTREDAAVEMMKKLDLATLKDADTIRLLTNTVNDCSIKALARTDYSVLQRTCHLRGKIEPFGIDKTKAVCVGEALKNEAAYRMGLIGLAGEIEQSNMTLKALNQSDYETYIKCYLDVFLERAQTANDISAIMHFFYHGKLFSTFISDYISALKKMEKKEHARWQHILAWTCIYTVDTKSDEAVGMLNKPLIHYMRTIDEEVLWDIRHLVVKEVPASQCEQLFNDVNRKEGLTDKLGDLFHKK